LGFPRGGGGLVRILNFLPTLGPGRYQFACQVYSRRGAKVVGGQGPFLRLAEKGLSGPI